MRFEHFAVLILSFGVFSLGYNSSICTSINMGTTQEANNVLKQGVYFSNWPKFDPKENYFAFYFRTANYSIFYYPKFSIFPSEGVFLTNVVHREYNANFSMYSYNITCKPMVSYRYSISLELIVHGCPSTTLTWVHTCSTGLAESQRGFVISTQEMDDSSIIVKDGEVVNTNYLDIPGKTTVGRYEDKITLYLYYFPVHKTNLSSPSSFSSPVIMRSGDYSTYYATYPISYTNPVLRYNESMVYPTMRGPGASKGTLNIHHGKNLDIIFNCFGIEGKTTLELVFSFPLSKPTILYIDKECSKGSAVDELLEAIVSEEKEYGALVLTFWSAFIFCFLISMISVCNLLLGKPCKDSVPFCGGLIEWVCSLCMRRIK